MDVSASVPIFRLGWSTLAVNAPDPWTSRLLESAYANMRSAESGTADHVASVAMIADGRFTVRFDRQRIDLPMRPGGDPLVGAYYVTREIFARFAAMQRGCIALYGTAVVVEGAAMLILGPTRVGKTVLALHLMHLGATLLSDETALLELRGGMLHGVPRRLVLRESALDRLPTQEMRDAVLACEHVCSTQQGRLWYALTEPEIGSHSAHSSYPLRSVYLIRTRSDTFTLRPITAAAALPAISQRAYARPTDLAATSALRRALRDVPCFDVVLGSPEETARGLLAEATLCV